MEKIDLNYQLYINREEFFIHQPYSNELDFYTAVKQGNIAFIEYIKKKYPPTDDDGKGRLSKDPVRNERYHFIVNVSIITRNCIDGGLTQEEAYTLSDLFIQKADALTTIAELRKLNDDMVYHFTNLMKKLHTRKITSLPVSRCIHFIYDNLHTKMTIESLSNHLNLNSSYLATLFKKETGYTVHSFIQNKRLETAETMLKCTDYSYAYIAHTLCFSSQSHFIRLFRKRNHMTPKEYRNQFGA